MLVQSDLSCLDSHMTRFLLCSVILYDLVWHRCRNRVTQLSRYEMLDCSKCAYAFRSLSTSIYLILKKYRRVSSPAKLAQLAHYGRVLIRVQFTGFSLGLLVIILEKKNFKENHLQNACKIFFSKKSHQVKGCKNVFLSPKLCEAQKSTETRRTNLFRHLTSLVSLPTSVGRIIPSKWLYKALLKRKTRSLWRLMRVMKDEWPPISVILCGSTLKS